MNMDYKEGRGDYYLAEGLREARRVHDQMVKDGHGMHECASDCPPVTGEPPRDTIRAWLDDPGTEVLARMEADDAR